MQKPYSKLGRVLDDLARKRDVRGPYRVAKYLEEKTGGGPSGATVSGYFYGEYYPKPVEHPMNFIERFAQAFELTEQERHVLGNTYSYPSDGAGAGAGVKDSGVA